MVLDPVIGQSQLITTEKFIDNKFEESNNNTALMKKCVSSPFNYLILTYDFSKEMSASSKAENENAYQD